MSKSKGPEYPSFSLETDDRTDDERAQSRQVKKPDRLVSALGLGSSGGPKTPMDSDYQDELEEAAPKIRFNLNFDKEVRCLEENKEDRVSKRFDIKRLFEAVSTGDVMKLEGLHQYLHQSMKKLSNTEYQSYGKNVLLKALLNLRKGRNNTIEYLLDISEKMGDIKEFVNAAYTDSYYKGQTALHIAIERRSIYFVELLIKKGANVHAKACGKFFQAHDGPSFYFGELPLSLAACTNQPEVVDFLLENDYQRVDVRESDSLGNMVLHALVVLADNTPENTDFITSMYDHILTTTARLHPEWRLEDIENNQGLTTIKLAAKTGKIGLFKHMMHREFQERETRHLSRKFTEWVYGPVHSSLYDLASLDSYEKNSVMEIIVYSSDIPPPFTLEHTRQEYLRLAGQLFITVGACYFFIRGILDLKRKRPSLDTLLIDGYSEILFFLQAIFFLASLVLYCCGREEYLGFLVLCLALSWVNLLYFSRGYRHMGIYSVMIQKMILSDILRFLFVYVTFLFGFSAAVVTLLMEPELPASNTAQPINSTDGKGRTLFLPTEDSCIKPTFRNISHTIMELFKFTIGMGDLEFTEGYQYKEVFYMLLISYIVLTYILLLNMLIALMSRTVEKMSLESTSIWKLQRAITILDLERSLPRCLRRRLRSGVDKDLGTRAGEKDRRWCFRVEEVNWNKWNTNLGIINEDPGSGDTARLSPSHSSRTLGKERSWRGFLGNVSRRQHTQPQHQIQVESTEMSSLSPLSHV
ncbi:transient receptor potential cation channel subfamily V member 1 isoform X2 [Salmo salar]|uniref:Transient receptor potential cation channel subfamily V member 1 isoform X2 n=1 Tax=Salmo salar TaxID=8030 RepID=A0A1S3RJT2_SALSA|nr:transient receptor potential cation channel subfamily V member 1 isoform X2 [Salmo salar]|eukprot:XP_014052550.1 PREDICTED: transient receptor potential cation channel subfamily V member 1 isoform X2 [Salmo salar]